MPTCRFCGKDFTVSDTTGVLYCSKKCREEYQRQYRREYGKRYREKYPLPKKPREEKERTCAVCGAVFRTASNAAKYCSDKCRSVASQGAAKLRGAESQERVRQWRENYSRRLEEAIQVPEPTRSPETPLTPETPRTPMELRTCAYCGEPFDPADSDARGDYCSERCRARVADRAAREKTLSKIERKKRKFAPMVACRWCGDRIELPDGVQPEACPHCGHADFEQLRRCHDCGKVCLDGSYRCPSCKSKWRRRNGRADVGVGGYEVHA